MNEYTKQNQKQTCFSIIISKGSRNTWHNHNHNPLLLDLHHRLFNCLSHSTTSLFRRRRGGGGGDGHHAPLQASTAPCGSQHPSNQLIQPNQPDIPRGIHRASSTHSPSSSDMSWDLAILSLVFFLSSILFSSISSSTMFPMALSMKLPAVQY